MIKWQVFDRVTGKRLTMGSMEQCIKYIEREVRFGRNRADFILIKQK